MSKLESQPERYDDLDRRIDNFLGQAGRLLRTLFILVLLGLALYFFVLPSWGTWGEWIFLILLFFMRMIALTSLVIVQLVAIFWLLGRPRIYWIMPRDVASGLRDFKGYPDALEAARQVVTFVKGARDFHAVGSQPIRGLLVVGPAGTGKSYLGQAIAAEAGVPFGFLSAPSTVGMFWGMDMLRVVSMYSKARGLARKYGACIVFVDEIDAIGRSRAEQQPTMGISGLLSSGGAGALNELLNQMDPMPRESWRHRFLRRLGLRAARVRELPVLTIAATVDAEVLDPALLRPGRFDRRIVLKLPNADGRREIIGHWLSTAKHDLLPLDRMASDTRGYAPIIVRRLLDEALVRAKWAGRDAIGYEDFKRAVEVHEWELWQPLRGMAVEAKRRIAYHEAGHAVASARLWPEHTRKTKISIARHGSLLDLEGSTPLEEQRTTNKAELVARIQVALAGRAAEQIFLGTELSGAHHDLQIATRVADHMVRNLGMAGSLYQPAALGQMAPTFEIPLIEDLLDKAFRQVNDLLMGHRGAVVVVAEALLEREQLLGQEVEQLVADAARAAQIDGRLLSDAAPARTDRGARLDSFAGAPLPLREREQGPENGFSPHPPTSAEGEPPAQRQPSELDSL